MGAGTRSKTGPRAGRRMIDALQMRVLLVEVDGVPSCI